MLRGIDHVSRNLKPSEPPETLGGCGYRLNLWTDADSRFS